MAQQTQITTYTELQGAIADTLNRSDLTSVIKSWVDLCEARFKRILRTKHKTTQTVSTTAGDGEYTINANVENYDLYIKSPETRAGPIDMVTPSQLYAWRQQFSGRQSYPRYGTIIDTELRLAPIPDDAYTIEIIGEAVFVPLSDSQASNYVLTNYPDVYLYGTLIHSAPYLKNDERLTMWDAMFKNALLELEDAQVRNEYPETLKAPVPGNFAPVAEYILRR